MARTYNRGVLGWNSQEEEWKFGSPNFNNFGASTQAEIDYLFRSGAYTFGILGSTITLNLVPPPVVSQPPSFTLTGGAWSGGKYVVDVHKTLTITSNTFDGYGATGHGGFMYMDVGPAGPGESVTFVSHNYADQPQANRLSVTIPPGRLSVNAQPWAEISLDGQAKGDTPLANLNVSVGEHEIVFRHPELGERRQTVIVRADQPARASVSFEK